MDFETFVPDSGSDSTMWDPGVIDDEPLARLGQPPRNPWRPPVASEPPEIDPALGPDVGGEEETPSTTPFDPACPRTPTRLADLGIPRGVLHDLVLRRILLDGESSTIRLASTLALSPVVVEDLLEQLRDLRYLEVRGLERRSFVVGLTDLGQRQADDRLERCRYAAAAPVSLEQYVAVVEAQQVAHDVHLEDLHEAFSDLVVRDELLRELGPALRANGAVFLYGPPGTGKSAIAERMNRTHRDHVLVPHAVEVDSQVITVFDPVVHHVAPDQPAGLDPRWVLCERPSIIAGGELTSSELNLTLEEGSGVYLAPLQMQANNGILVIDDFGRQTMTPEQMLNRWIVPLDRGVDYLTLSYGLKFKVPCTPKIVFSTNLEPATLGDEAFFRRIRSKVLIPPIGDDQFDEILERVAPKFGVSLTPETAEYLRWVSRHRGDGDLRPYLPAAVCDLVESICGFERVPKVLDRAMVDRITTLYFTRSPERGPAT
ncbi:MAG: AAA family ATPase [Acidimicrobiia bacterium]|nr:AAA family ATPase [Acidimicrobiia bacterium]